MKRQMVITLAGILVFGLGRFGLAADPAHSLERYIIHTAGNSAANQSASQRAEEHAGHVLKTLATGTGVVVYIPEVAIEHIQNTPGVLAVEPDVMLSAVKPPPDKGKPPKDDPLSPSPQEVPWGIDRIDAEYAWNSETGSGVTVAIVDTGIDSDHPDLIDNLVGGTNYVASGKGPLWRRTVDPEAWDDDNGHGTHVAGIAAAVNNSLGVVGVAPEASLLAVKVLDSSGSGYISDIADGIIWAADNGAAIINLSLGITKEVLEQYPLDLALLVSAVNYATAASEVVAAAGNEGPGEDTVLYPARIPAAIAVTATDSADGLAYFSSTGPSVDIAAPGVDILSCWNDGDYTILNGTSMAAPHVAGTLALVNYDIFLTADDIGLLPSEQGVGLVDAEEAATGTESGND